MTSNILDLFHQTTGDEFINKVSAFLGESTENISLATKSYVPSLMGGLIKKNHEEYGAAEIFDFISEQNFEGKFVSNLKNTAIGDQGDQWVESGAEVLNFIFSPEKNIQESISNIVSSTSGIHAHSGEMLLKLEALMTIDALGMEVKTKNLDISALKSLFHNQKEAIKKEIPVSIFDALGLETVFSEEESEQAEVKPTEVTSNQKHNPPETVKAPVDEPEKQEIVDHASGNSVVSRIIPWIILISLAILLFYIMRTCGGQPESIKGG